MDKIKAFFEAGWAFIRRLPFAKFFKPLWKSGLKALVHSEGEKLEAKINQGLHDKGPAAIDQAVDAFKAGCQKVADWAPLPRELEDKVLAFLVAEAEIMRSRLKVSVEGGAPALHAVMQQSENILIAKIDAL